MREGREARGRRRVTICLLAALVVVLAPSGASGLTLPWPLSVLTPPAQGSPAPVKKKAAKKSSAPVNPFAVRGMWIWYLSSSNGGSLGSINSRARRYGIKTLLIKSGDGSNRWPQFSSAMVSKVHSYGLHVCAWQYVYGTSPVAEANVGAASVKAGADCLVIDAEGEYEGKYAQAQTYINQLRSKIGSTFPVGLAGFPYVDYHPAYPYSVFLGPNGAQYNVPQMYWFDIGTSVTNVYSHTYAFNRPYGRAVYPLGQIYNNPPTSDVLRFRQLSQAYKAGGVSWWDWQEATGTMWRAISKPLGHLAGFTPNNGFAYVGLHARGDLVVWAQEHLVSAGYPVKVDGSFGSTTQQAVKSFQRAKGINVTGIVGSATWRALLRYPPSHVHWGRDARAASDGGSGLPVSASLPDKANELRGAPGRG
jgi:hypothetical protein